MLSELPMCARCDCGICSCETAPPDLRLAASDVLATVDDAIATGRDLASLRSDLVRLTESPF